MKPDPIFPVAFEHCKSTVNLEFAKEALFKILWGPNWESTAPKNISLKTLKLTVKRFNYLNQKAIDKLEQLKIEKEKAREKKNVVKQKPDISHLPKEEREAILDLEKAIDVVQNGKKSIEAAETKLLASENQFNLDKEKLNKLTKDYLNRGGEKNLARNMFDDFLKLQKIIKNEEEKEIPENKKNLKKVREDYVNAIKHLQSHVRTHSKDPEKLIKIGRKKIKSLIKKGLKKVKEVQKQNGKLPGLVNRSATTGAKPSGVFEIPQLRRTVSSNKDLAFYMKDFYAYKAGTIGKAYRGLNKTILPLQEEIDDLTLKIKKLKHPSSQILKELEEKEKELQKAKEIEQNFDEIKNTEAFQKRWENDARRYAEKSSRIFPVRSKRDRRKKVNLPSPSPSSNSDLQTWLLWGVNPKKMVSQNSGLGLARGLGLGMFLGLLEQFARSCLSCDLY